MIRTENVQTELSIKKYLERVEHIKSANLLIIDCRIIQTVLKWMRNDH